MIGVELPARLRSPVDLPERDAAGHLEGAAIQAASSRTSASEGDVPADGVLLPRGGHG